MQQKDTEQYNRLKSILADMFQLNQAELDFGIYRIMNQKRKEINQFLDEDLLTQIREVLEQSGDAGKEELKQEIEKLETTLREAGMNPDESQKVQEMREEYGKGGSIEAMELEVYSRLTQFFKRYYKEGDFISQRRYKEGVYAIPYEGEEVKLHWANHDQYYIKTGEHFKNYSFKADGKSIHFVLKEADTERDNNKAQAGKERRFKLYQTEENPSFEETEAGDLNIYFTYEPTDKKEKQKQLNEATLKTLQEQLPGEWSQIVLQKKPTEKNKNRTLLEYRLKDYTAKNSFDYFIHKDLGKFLRRELDFYIKNEILHLDDINLDDPTDFQKQLTTIKALKKVALKIIAFLAQLEDFQKKLFLKKKMVLQRDYCITLDRIDESFYPDIANNEAQLKEWEELFATDEIEGFKEGVRSSPVETLNANPYLLLDTQFFPTEWKYKLLATLPDIDEQCDGLLINSENFQALNLLQERYREQVDCVYIDPPYNAKSSEIVYKNTYKNSSFATFMDNRVDISYSLIKNNGKINVAIDDYEFKNVHFILDSLFGNENFIANIVITHNPRGRNDDKFFGTSHEYMLVYSKDISLATINDFPLDEKSKKQYNREDEISKFAITSYMRTGNNSNKFERPNLHYPIYIDRNDYSLSLERGEDTIEVLPINSKNEEKTWRWGTDTFMKRKDTELFIQETSRGFQIYKKRRMIDVGRKPKTTWSESRYDASANGIMFLRKYIGKEAFSYPKSIYTVIDALQVTAKKESIILDYFAGSGTTAHAVINLNREDSGNRKYILVEMGEYFNSVTKPRVQKVIYSEDWKNGKPVSRKGSSHCFKYMRLESYEDTLNNLYLKQGEIDEAMREEYLLQYALNVESRDSLLMLDAFKKPFGYKIKSTENNELKETEVDLVETFNYLIGLKVKTMEIIRGYVVITGETLEEKQVLVIWRDLEQHSNADLNEFCQKMKFNPLDSEFDQIYVNGDNNIENLKIGEERWKVNLIEHEFHKRMWDNG